MTQDPTLTRVQLTLASTAVYQQRGQRRRAATPQCLGGLLSQLKHDRGRDPLVFWEGNVGRKVGIFHRDTLELVGRAPRLVCEASIRLAWLGQDTFASCLAEGRWGSVLQILPSTMERRDAYDLVTGARPGIVSLQRLEDTPAHLRAFAVVPIERSGETGEPARLHDEGDHR